MDFIKMGKGSKINELNMKDNIVVSDDPSLVKSFIDMGENAEIKTLDADGNQVLTTEAYKEQLKIKREPFLVELEEFKFQLDKLENDLHKARIKRELLAVDKYINDYSSRGQFELKAAVKFLKDCCVNVGCGVIAGIITTI